MKELSVEEKAERYDEAIKRIENIKTGKCETTFVFTEGVFEYIFPELKENGDSEDEKIRKSIIEFVKQNKSFHYLLGVSKEDALAWLEKQGEKKQKQYDIDILEKHITKDSISELAHTVIVRNGWEIVEAKEQKPVDKVEPKFKKD